MEHFAHIFIGKEFAEIVSNIGRQVCKYGGEDILSSVNLFVVDDKNVRQLLYPENPVTVKDVILKSPSVEPSWRDVGVLSGETEKDKDLFLNEIFNHILSVRNIGTHASLYLVLHFPLYKKGAMDTAKLLYKSIKAAERPVELNFMGYCDDLAPVIEPEHIITSPSKRQVADYMEFRDAEGITYNTHFIVMQNTSQNGISLCLDSGTFASVIGHFAILCANSYHDIFPNTVEYKDAVAIGLSTLYLDKYLYAEYLLSKAMLNAMDHVHVNDKCVDANTAYVTVDKMLEDKATLLSKLFAEIDMKQKHEDDKEFPVIQQNFADEAQQIVERCTKTLGEQKAITMQAAILAVCLAKTDCELFSETIFSQDIVTVDKLFDEPIDYFINNDHAKYYQLGGNVPVNPINELKELDTRLINSETSIRNLKDDIEKLTKQIGESEKVTDCYIEDGFMYFRDQKYRLLPSVEQEPLAETYTPHAVDAKSLDLRSKFTCIKNQGQQGSCLSFALTSIFEYVMQLNQAEEYDLSEAFLYYNARDIDGDGSVNEDSGSRFKPSIDSLAKYGIALERVWPYNDQIYSQKPSDAAYSDAASRKLLSAMNVNRTVADIKSALADGCPVAASFTLTQSFADYGRAGGYIPMPSDAEIAAGMNPESEESRHSRHAMVIVGFSDELQMFIVRNSWGDDWGDNGYCYIPYPYIEHKDLFNYACIITEIENLVAKKLDFITPLTIDTGDLTIQIAIKRNELYIEEHVAEQLRSDKAILRAYFEQLKQMYCNPNQRDRFIDANKVQITAEQDELKQTIKQKDLEHETNDESYKAYKKEALLRCGTFLLGTTLLAVMYKQLVTLEILALKPLLAWLLVYVTLSVASYFLRKQTFIKAFWMSLWGVAGALGAKALLRLGAYFIGNGDICTYFKNFFWKDNGINFIWLLLVLAVAGIVVFLQARRRWQEWRDERDRIDADVDRLQKEIRVKEREKELFKLKTFSAWTLLTKLQDIQTKFYAHYTNLISLINNMRAWYKDLDEREENYTLKTPFPDTSLLTPELLDEFFDNYLKNDPDLQIDFCADISSYQITLESLAGYKETLVERIINKLIERREISTFDISGHVSANLYRDIAEEVDRKMATSLDDQSGIFLNVNSSERGIIVPSTSIFAPSLALFRDSLRKKLGKYSEPYFESADRYRMTYLKTATVWFRECVNFK